MNKIKEFIWLLVQLNPFGYFAVFKHGNLTVKVDKKFYVHICDGNSVDMLPITFCSQELVDAFEREILSKWYFPSHKEIQQ